MNKDVSSMGKLLESITRDSETIRQEQRRRIKNGLLPMTSEEAAQYLASKKKTLSSKDIISKLIYNVKYKISSHYRERLAPGDPELHFQELTNADQTVTIDLTEYNSFVSGSHPDVSANVIAAFIGSRMRGNVADVIRALPNYDEMDKRMPFFPFDWPSHNPPIYCWFQEVVESGDGSDFSRSTNMVYPNKNPAWYNFVIRHYGSTSPILDYNGNPMSTTTAVNGVRLNKGRIIDVHGVFYDSMVDDNRIRPTEIQTMFRLGNPGVTDMSRRINTVTYQST